MIDTVDDISNKKNSISGYKFSFPFLTFDAGVTVKNKVVQPLYKKILCVEHPTLAFIGLNAAPVQSFDLQVKYAVFVFFFFFQSIELM